MSSSISPNDPVDGDLLRTIIRLTVTGNGDGERLLTDRPVVSRIESTIDIAVVSLHRYLLRRLPRVPSPVAIICHPFRQLRDEFYLLTISRNRLCRAHLIIIFQSAEVRLVHISHTLIFNVTAQHQGSLVSLYEWSIGSERRESEMVEASRSLSIITATPVDADSSRSLFSILHLHAAYSLIISEDTVPVRPVPTYSPFVGRILHPCLSHCSSTVRIIISDPWQRGPTHPTEVECRYMLYTCRQAVIHISEEVIPLVICHLTDIHSQSECHERMPLITSALLHLSEIPQWSPLVREHHRHKVTDELVTAIVKNLCIGRAVSESTHMVILIEAHPLIIDMNIITENTYRHQAERVTEPPVAPVVPRSLTLAGISSVAPRVMSASDEVERHGIPCRHHIPLELLKLLTFPTLIVAHQFCGLSQLITIDAGRQRFIRVAAHIFVSPCPSHEDTYGSIGIIRCPTDLPSQRILISHRCAARNIHIVLPRRSPTDDRLRRPCLYRSLRILIAAELVPCRRDARVTVGESSLDTFKILLRMQTTRMPESLSAGRKERWRLRLITLAGSNQGHSRLQRLYLSVNDLLRELLSLTDFPSVLDSIPQFHDSIRCILLHVQLSEEVFSLLHLSLQAHKVAGRTIAEFSIEVLTLSSHSFHLIGPEHPAIHPNVRHHRPSQIVIRRERCLPYPAAGRFLRSIVHRVLG